VRFGFYILWTIGGFLMARKPTYEELEQKVKELEEGAGDFRAEKAFWESEGTFRAIYGASDSISFVTTDLGVEGKDPQITSFSPGAEKMFGYSEREVIGKSIVMFHLSEDIEKTVPKTRESIKKKEKGYEGEITLIRKSGDHFLAFFAVHPLFDAKGKILGGLWISIDISGNKNRQSQLHQAAKMESLGTLAKGIAHDFNNILGVIIGNTELAIDEMPRWNPVHHNLEKARKACLRGKDLVKQIQIFNQQTEPKMTPTRVTPIIEDTLKFLRSSIPSSVEICHDILSDSDTIIADPIQINQVLISLCTNSAHAIGQNGGTFGISLENVILDEETAASYDDLPAGNYLRLTVNDTGHGIEPDILHRIFDPYFTTKEPGEGTGMGLAVAIGIIRNHNGTIKAYSEQGKGATFHIYLPLVEVEVSEKTGKEEFLPTGDERILFIDDEQELVNLGKQVLGRLGYSVITRTSSSEALELFRENSDQFDLVITDLTMPTMTGDRLGKELIKLRPDISIIVCSGSIEHDLIDKAKDLGVKAILEKPVEMKNLANTVRKVLDEKRGR